MMKNLMQRIRRFAKQQYSERWSIYCHDTRLRVSDPRNWLQYDKPTFLRLRVADHCNSVPGRVRWLS
jgi:hypothetical protein